MPESVQILIQPINHKSKAMEDTAAFDQASSMTAIDFECDFPMEASLESRLLDDAITSMLSLPQVCQQVVLQQKDQCSELKQYRHILAEKKDKLRAAENAIKEVKDEVNSLQRRAYLTEEDLQDVDKQSKTLRSDLDSLLAREHQLHSEIATKGDELVKMVTLFDEYVDKMKQHAELVKQQEQTSDVFTNLVEYRRNVDNLKRQMADAEAELSSSNKQEDDPEDYGEQLATAELQIKHWQSQFDEERKKQMEMEKCTEVLHKRNAAQMTRLRKRLQEVQGRNRHWRDQASQLQASLDNITRYS